jgi:transcriptional regulator with XRE-family HTH domain
MPRNLHPKRRASRKRNIEALKEALGPYVAPTPQAIRYLRQALRMTQVMFARQFGVAPNAVKQWESGRRGCKPDIGRRMRELAGMNQIDMDFLSDKAELKVFMPTETAQVEEQPA